MVTFIILSLEGPDPYSLAGGLGSRVTGLSNALATLGHSTHLFFIGDPDKPGHEATLDGHLHLHRWCQWISRYHPAGVYDGEEGKLYDWNRSLIPWIESTLLEPGIAAGEEFVILAEEWQTADSAIVLGNVLARRGWTDRVRLLWNANNTYSFNRVNWAELRRVAQITTVSRYMKHAMWPYGVDARVIPNGIPDSWINGGDRKARAILGSLFQDRLAVVKVARWHPDKRWNMAIGAVAQLKSRGLRPLLLARGGLEEHKGEVLANARSLGLTVGEARWEGCDFASLAKALTPIINSDVVVLETTLSEVQSKALFHSADAVLANSGVEPFGLVGLETMAAGGVAFVGATGEDYATPGFDAVSLQTNDPREIAHHLEYLHDNRRAALGLRDAARRTAERYTWQAVIRRTLLPCLGEMGVQFGAEPGIENTRPLRIRTHQTTRTVRAEKIERAMTSAA